MNWRCLPILALMLLAAPQVAHADTTYASLDRIAQKVTGNPSEHVACYPTPAAGQNPMGAPASDPTVALALSQGKITIDGFVLFNKDGTLTTPGTVHLDGTLCGTLNVAASEPHTHRSIVWVSMHPGPVGYAAHTLLHELTHDELASQDEGRVECSASQNDYPMARALGLPARLVSPILQWMRHAHTTEPLAVYSSVC